MSTTQSHTCQQDGSPFPLSPNSPASLSDPDFDMLITGPLSEWNLRHEQHSNVPVTDQCLDNDLQEKPLVNYTPGTFEAPSTGLAETTSPVWNQQHSDSLSDMTMTFTHATTSSDPC